MSFAHDIEIIERLPMVSFTTLNLRSKCQWLRNYDFEPFFSRQHLEKVMPISINYVKIVFGNKKNIFFYKSHLRLQMFPLVCDDK